MSKPCVAIVLTSHRRLADVLVRRAGSRHRRGTKPCYVSRDRVDLRDTQPMVMAVNWGTVPEWIGAASTGAALLVGLLVFRSERADRQSETARRVFVTYQEDRTLLIRNDGPTPVQQMTISLSELVMDAVPGRNVAYLSVSHLQPGEQQVREPVVDEGASLPRITVYALDWHFVDGDGRAWHRDWRGALNKGY